MAVNKKKLSFYSGANYMKREKIGQTEAPAMTIAAGSFATTPLPHNFGFVPFFVWSADLQGNGIWWAGKYVYNSNEYQTIPPEVRVYADEQNLYIRRGTHWQDNNRAISIRYCIYGDFRK